MSASIDACLQKVGVTPPDPWRESYGVSLPLEHVVACDANGAPASRVGDFEWDLTAYSSHGQKCVLHFVYWAGSRRTAIDASQWTDARIWRMRELQFLMCKLLYPLDGTTSSPRSLMRKLLTLRGVAVFAELHDLWVRDIFEQREWLDAFIAKTPDFQCSQFMIWLSFLHKLDPVTELGFRVAKPLRIKELVGRARQYRAQYKQHAPLPTRIYSQLIANLATELDDIEAHKERLIALLREGIRLSLEAKAAGWRSYDPPNRSLGFRLITKHGLASYFDKRGYGCSMQAISGVVGEIFHLCALQIHAFTGMRQNEGRTLPFHCMEFERRDGRRHALLIGTTTKFNGGRRLRTKWVTTEKEGFRAVRLAQDFARLIYDGMGATPSDDTQNKDRYPLFVSPDYFPWGQRGYPAPDASREQFHPPKERSTGGCMARLLPTIAAADIDELEDVDPFRAWAEEVEFAIGKRWPLTKHQLRRSLALYARASGCVRLSSLRRQLQHISNDMSVYYGNGCAFAKDFLSEDPDAFAKHIAHEWQRSEEEAMVLAMIWDVLHSDEPLYGGAGHFYDNQRRNGSLITREQLEQGVKAGTLRYTTHPLGGCTSPGPCGKRTGLNFIAVACATENCKNLVGKHSKVLQVIKAQRGMLERIDPTSLTYKYEKEGLDELLEVEERWRLQSEQQEFHGGVDHV